MDVEVVIIPTEVHACDGVGADKEGRNGLGL